MSMLAHWQKMITVRGPIDITSLVTCIATHVGALDNAQVTYLPLIEASSTSRPIAFCARTYDTRGAR
jgi:hypothetical protein